MALGYDDVGAKENVIVSSADMTDETSSDSDGDGDGVSTEISKTEESQPASVVSPSNGATDVG